MKCIGLIPAAGVGNRLQPLPFSKEMFPFGYQNINGQTRVRPISLHLVSSLKEAGVQQLYFVINPKKTDIPRYYSNGSQLDVHISYLVQPEPKGLVDALAQATPWLSEQEEVLIFFGMPDTYFQPSNLYQQIKQEMLESDYDVLLGVFPTKTWWKLGMVSFAENKDGKKEISNIIEKPSAKPDTDYAWGVAVWKLPFQHYLTKHLASFTGEGELLFSEVFLSAMADGYKFGYVMGEEYTDIGTIEELMSAIAKLHKTLGDAEREGENAAKGKCDTNNV